VTQLISSGATWMPHSCCNRKSNKKREVVSGVFGPGGVALGVRGQSQTVHLHALALITFTLNF